MITEIKSSNRFTVAASKKLRNVLIKGICHRDRWANYNNNFHNPFIHNLWQKNRKEFKFTKRVQNGLNQLVIEAIGKLEITQNPEIITQRVIEIGLIEKYYDYKDWIEKKRNK